MALFQKNPRAHKNKPALPSPPKKNPKYPPPLKRGILGHGGLPAERTQFFQAPKTLTRLGKLWSWQIAGFREITPKWLGEGAKGLWAQSGQHPFAPVKCWVAPVQNRVWVVQSPFLRLLLPCPKRPFAPSPNHFGRFA